MNYNMAMKPILLLTFFVVNFSNASILSTLPFPKDWYTSFNRNFDKVNEFTSSLLKKPENELLLRPAVSKPEPAYKPEVPKLEKKKSELFEICKLSLEKSDIVMLTVIKKDSNIGLKPIMINPSALELSFKVEKSKKLPALFDAFKSVKSYKKHGINKIPINLQLDPKVLSTLPVLKNEDFVLLTIIKLSKKKGPKVVSHFVDKISAAPIYKPL